MPSVMRADTTGDCGAFMPSVMVCAMAFVPTSIDMPTANSAAVRTATDRVMFFIVRPSCRLDCVFSESFWPEVYLNMPPATARTSTSEHPNKDPPDSAQAYHIPFRHSFSTCYLQPSSS